MGFQQTLEQIREKHVGRKFKYISPYSGLSKWTGTIKLVHEPVHHYLVNADTEPELIFYVKSTKGVLFELKEIVLQ